MMPVASNPLQTAPGALPLIGHVPQFLRDKLGFLSKCAKTDAAVVRLRLAGDAYLLLDADDIKHVLDTNHPNYDKSERMTSSRGKRVSGYGVLTASGREHLEKRRLIQPVFAANNIAPFTDATVQETDRILATWRDGQEMDIAEAVMDIAQCINGRVLFSADYRGHDATLGEAIRVRRRFTNYVFNSLLPYPEYLPTPMRLGFDKAQKLIDQDVQNRIAQRRAAPDQYQDFLGRLVAIMDDRDAYEEAVTTAITGYETIGEALAWTCLLLARHPEIGRKLVEEMTEVLGTRLPTFGDLARLRYAEMVINESMRLYPPTWIYVRMSKNADRLPSGVDLPAGAKLYLCPWVIHRSDRYFDDPSRFDPLRFEDEPRKSRPKYAYFPFGGGPRVCIGQWLAKMEMPLVLAMIVQRFSISLLPGQTIVPEPKITLRPGPAIRVQIRQR